MLNSLAQRLGFGGIWPGPKSGPFQMYRMAESLGFHKLCHTPIFSALHRTFKPVKSFSKVGHWAQTVLALGANKFMKSIPGRASLFKIN